MNMFPLYYTRWNSKFWETALQQIWKEVQTNTNTPGRFKKLNFARIATSWKSFKWRIRKNYYLKYKTDEERLAHKPDEILKEQWAELVAYWGSDISKLLSTATFLGGIFCFSAFCYKSLYAFMAFFLIGEIVVFATQGPVNFVCLHTVKPSLRPISMAMSTVSIHIFGDVSSAPLVCLVPDQLHNWRKSSLILTSVLFVSAGIRFIGIFLHSVDRFNEDDEHQDLAVERSHITPLLEETTIETRKA